MGNFDALTEAFGPGSLSFAKWSLRGGEHLNPKTVAAVKEANSNWQDDAEFAAFDAWSDGGKKRRRGRPRDVGKKNWEQTASAFYPVVMRLARRRRRLVRLDKVVTTMSDKHPADR